jgi:hypothetical protein
MAEFDGSGMLRGAATTAPISRVGDVFVMMMYYSEHGDYEMNNHVVEYEPDQRVGWEPEAGRGHPAAGSSDAGSSDAGSTDAGGRWGHRCIRTGRHGRRRRVDRGDERLP